jgi:hypothetical protein
LIIWWEFVVVELWIGGAWIVLVDITLIESMMMKLW